MSEADAELLQLSSVPVAGAVPQEWSMYVAKADVERWADASLGQYLLDGTEDGRAEKMPGSWCGCGTLIVMCGWERFLDGDPVACGRGGGEVFESTLRVRLNCRPNELIVF